MNVNLYKLIEKIFKQNIEDETTLNLALDVLNQRENLIQENQKYKEVINKAINNLEKGISFCKHDSQGVYDKCNIAILREQKILEILKEVEHEKSNN